MKQFFLIQVSEIGSSSLVFEDKYRNNNWKRYYKDSNHGDVNVGDILVAYFTGRAIRHPSQIRFIYEVKNISKEQSTFHVELYQEINPLSLSDIEELVDNKLLSPKFRLCGHQGFNITKTSQSDYSLLHSRRKDKSDYTLLHSKRNDKSYVKENLDNRLTEEYIKLLENASDINLLIFYQDNYNMMSSSIKRKLSKAGLIQHTNINGMKRTVLTKKGVSLLKQGARQLELL